MALTPTIPLLPHEPRPVPAHKAVAPAAKASGNAAAATADAKTEASAQEGFSFRDFLDIINPLQHIPIVSTIYREVTGDKIGGFARIVGGALFGGPIGAVLGGANAIAAQETGKDIGELAMAKVGFGTSAKADTTQIAQATPPTLPKNIPVIEVRPLAQQTAQKMPEIIWDTPALATVLPPAQAVEKLPEVANAAAPSDKSQIPQLMLQALQKYQEMQSQAPRA